MIDSLALPFDEPSEAAKTKQVSPARSTSQPRRIMTVSELTSEIRGLLESSYSEILVDGEISNCRLWNTGHLYFTLKDDHSQLKVVMFRTTVRYLKFQPENGLRVIARGQISVYEPKGEYQIVCRHLEPYGIGTLQLAFEQLKEKLRKEGLFNDERKKPLPALPRKIGIVTSLDSAALRDIIKVLRRRYPNAHLLIRPARVQGVGAADDIARAVTQIGSVPGVDVIITGRGGGSMEDLWAFNEESVARAISASSVPIISAVGHETDFTIADFVADLRAATPSAAAELVITRKDEYHDRINRLSEQLRARTLMQIHEYRTDIRELEQRPGLSGLPGRVAILRRQVTELAHNLARGSRGIHAIVERHYHALELRLEGQNLRRTFSKLLTQLVSSEGKLHETVQQVAMKRRATLVELSGRLESLSPLAVLARGYAVCWDAKRLSVLTNSNKITPGDSVRITLHRGELGCVVKDTK